MADRAFKNKTLAVTNTAQPLIFATITAAAAVGPSGFGQGDSLTTLTVDDSFWFLKDDFVTMCSPTQTLVERVRVWKIVDSTHVTVQGMTQARSANDLMILSIPCSTIYVQPTAGGAGAMGIGTAYDCAIATGVHLRVILQKVAAGSQPVDWTSSRTSAAPDPINSSDYWIVGTNPDTYLASLGLV